MLIQNYGLFWRREKVSWGAQGRGRNGTLLGRYARHLRDAAVDFREQQGVYVLFDDSFKVVYVGQAGRGEQRLFNRLRNHKSDHLAERWSRFSWFGLLPVVNGVLNLEHAIPEQPVVGVLNHIEAILIAAAEPPLNLQRGRFGNEVQQYLQHQLDLPVDENVGDGVAPG
jgi:hypothetical protein